MTILHWECGGYAMYYKRLERYWFHPSIFLRQSIGLRLIRCVELVILMVISTLWTTQRTQIVLIDADVILIRRQLRLDCY